LEEDLRVMQVGRWWEKVRSKRMEVHCEGGQGPPRAVLLRKKKKKVVVIGAYAPTNDTASVGKDKFWDTLRDILQEIPRRKVL
jgi:hypothetical protein